MLATASLQRPSATLSDCISAFHSVSACAWSRRCWQRVASSSATRPCGNGRLSLARSSPTESGGDCRKLAISLPYRKSLLPGGLGRLLPGSRRRTSSARLSAFSVRSRSVLPLSISASRLSRSDGSISLWTMRWVIGSGPGYHLGGAIRKRVGVRGQAFCRCASASRPFTFRSCFRGRASGAFAPPRQQRYRVA